MQTVTSWLLSVLFGGPDNQRSPRDQEQFARREAELRERMERLERMAIEADVISRTDRSEGSGR